MKRILFAFFMAFLAVTAHAYSLYTPAGTVDVGYTNTEGLKATYSAVIPAFTPAATATDFITITGASSKTVTITSINITGAATGGVYADVYIYKRTTANTGGTTATISSTKHDSLDGNPVAVVKSYSANPSALGSGTIVRGDHVALPSGASGQFARTYNFTDRASKGIKLRGSSESVSLNYNGAAVSAGTSLFITIEWTEE